jgi:hypothetical protein
MDKRLGLRAGLLFFLSHLMLFLPSDFYVSANRMLGRLSGGELMLHEFR